MNTNITQQPEDQAVMAAIVDIRHISEQQLAQLGLQQIAYVKPVDGQRRRVLRDPRCRRHADGDRRWSGRGVRRDPPARNGARAGALTVIVMP